MTAQDVSQELTPSGERTDRERLTAWRLGIVMWALAFAWLGVALLAGWSDWPTLLIGLGAIAAAVQAVRISLRIPVERTWLIVGLVFVAAGLWQIFGTVGIDLAPFALLVGSATLVVRLVWFSHIGPG